MSAAAGLLHFGVLDALAVSPLDLGSITNGVLPPRADDSPAGFDFACTSGAKPWRWCCPLSLAGPVPTVRQVCDARAIAEPTVLIGNYLHDSLPCDALWIGSCAPPCCKRSATRCNAAPTTVQRSAHHGAT